MIRSAIRSALLQPRRVGFGPSRGFAVSSLFAAGEQGAWFDASDFSTMFQDAAGTTPVTSPEQPVGLWLDRSKGLVRVNMNPPSTGSTAGWSNYLATITSDGTSITATNSSDAEGYAYVLQGQILAGRTYEVSFEVVSRTHTFGTLQVGQTPISVQGTGPKSVILRATNTHGIWLGVGASVTGNSVTIKNLQVRELPGNHATQSTAASRPVVSRRVNQWIKTDNMSDPAWTKQAGATVGTDGLVTLSATNNCGVSQPSGLTGQVKIRFRAKNVNVSAPVEIVNGGGTTLATYTPTVDWQWYEFSVNTPSSTIYPVFRRTATPGESLYVADLDIRLTADALPGIPAYQRVNTATDYDGVGFPAYLRFDGVDDSLSTGNIDFTGTDKVTVWAGVTKLSDAGAAAVELSAVADSNNGSFNLYLTGGYAATLRGTSLGNRGYTPFAAPRSDVVALAFNLANPGDGSEIAARFSGVATAHTSVPNGLDSGGGTFGNYPLNIGRRNNSVAPANMRLYSLIVRGAASNDAQITGTERWIAPRIGVTL